MSHPVIETQYYTVVVVRTGERFLLVQETKHDHRWYFPAGHLEIGEDFVQAALRETREEAGIEIQLDGILRVEHTPRADGGTRVGVLFLARPKRNLPLKSVPDEMSLGAAWVTAQDVEQYPPRGPEVSYLMAYVLASPRVYPLDVVQRAGTPFPRLD